jgi:hypothetical protein
MEVFNFSYSWEEEVERELREREERARMEVRIQMDLPVTVFDVSRYKSRHHFYQITVFFRERKCASKRKRLSWM